MVAGTETFTTRLAAVIAGSGSLLCLGLDPDGMSDAAAAERHCHALLDATLDSVCAVKPNLAFFEQFGSAGYAVLERLRAAVPSDRLLILDGKRGDIASTMTAYARALFDVLGADVVTVNPLLGGDSIAPLLARPGRGILVLARTSNPGAADFLERPDAVGGVTLYQRIVEEAMDWDRGGGAVGFVVGATAPAAVAEIRRLAPSAPLLLPGVGAQGGALEASLAAALDGEGGGAIVSVSRAIAAAPQGPAVAARELRDRISAVRTGR
ncbi:MAG TPA: orotidine-5'-phosphate decarboxylase [Candidatus Dormibacteraeota bacterium]|nr:orotidine-5'-phosphate decarboxylase [Candidatus Dormibacteraeota bacterium]